MQFYTGNLDLIRIREFHFREREFDDVTATPNPAGDNRPPLLTLSEINIMDREELRKACRRRNCGVRGTKPILRRNLRKWVRDETANRNLVQRTVREAEEDLMQIDPPVDTEMTENGDQQRRVEQEEEVWEMMEEDEQP